MSEIPQGNSGTPQDKVFSELFPGMIKEYQDRKGTIGEQKPPDQKPDGGHSLTKREPSLLETDQLQFLQSSGTGHQSSEQWLPLSDVGHSLTERERRLLETDQLQFLQSSGTGPAHRLMIRLRTIASERLRQREAVGLNGKDAEVVAENSLRHAVLSGDPSYFTAALSYLATRPESLRRIVKAMNTDGSLPENIQIGWEQGANSAVGAFARLQITHTRGLSTTTTIGSDGPPTASSVRPGQNRPIATDPTFSIQRISWEMLNHRRAVLSPLNRGPR